MTIGALAEEKTMMGGDEEARVVPKS